MSAFTVFGQSVSSGASVTLPTVPNHMAIYTNTTGSISEDSSIVVTGGSIQAGASGTSGSLISYPSTAGLGSLSVSSSNNASNFTVTLTNASMAQASIITIPDPGPAANFLYTSTTNTFTNLLISTATIGTLIAASAIIGSIATTSLTGTNLTGTSGTVASLLTTNINFTTGTMTSLVSTSSSINSLTVTNASLVSSTFGTLQLNSITLTNLNIASGTIGTLLTTNSNVTSGSVASLTGSTSNITISSVGTLTTNGTVNFNGTLGSYGRFLYTGGADLSTLTRIPFSSSSTGGIRPPTMTSSGTGGSMTVNLPGIYTISYFQTGDAGGSTRTFSFTIKINGTSFENSFTGCNASYTAVSSMVSGVHVLALNDVVTIAVSTSGSVTGGTNGTGYMARIG